MPFPPNHGGKIRAFHIIRHLAKSHKVTVACPARSADEVHAAAALMSYCDRLLIELIPSPKAAVNMLLSLPTPGPSSVAYFYSHRLATRMRVLLARERFDLVIAHCAFAAPYVSWVENPAKLLDFCDMDSQKWLAYARARAFPLSLGYLLEAHKLRRLEARLARRFDFCTCATASELATLKSYGLDVAAECFPNGVDEEFFCPPNQPYDPDTVAFVGRLDYYPNQQGIRYFCEHAWPLIRARRPQATLRIVGASPPRAVRALGRLPGVTVIPNAPDIRPYVATAAVSIAPLQIARGTQNKILESLAMGVPTVVSPEAARGVDAEPGQHLLIASSPSEFADAILRLLRDPEERRRLSQAGRARVLSRHSWSRALTVFERLLDRTLALARRRQSDPVANLGTLP